MLVLHEFCSGTVLVPDWYRTGTGLLPYLQRSLPWRYASVVQALYMSDIGAARVLHALVPGQAALGVNQFGTL